MNDERTDVMVREFVAGDQVEHLLQARRFLHVRVELERLEICYSGKAMVASVIAF
jgi:hypothetical protein